MGKDLVSTDEFLKNQSDADSLNQVDSRGSDARMLSRFYPPETVEYLVDALFYWPECKELIKHLKRPGLIGGRHGS